MSAAEPAAAAEVSLATLAFALLALPDGAAGPEAEWLSRRDSAAAAPQLTPAQLVARWARHPPDEDRSLHALAGALHLSPIEALAVALTRTVETDPMAGRALAFLQSPAGGARPTVGLVLTAVSAFDPAPVAVQLTTLLDGPARETGLLLLESESRPLPESALRTPVPLVLALDGVRPAWSGIRTGVEDRPPLPASALEEAARHARALRGKRQVLLIRSRQPGEALAAAQTLAADMGAEAAFCAGDPPAGLGPWLWLTSRIPVLCLDLAPGEHRAVPPIPGYSGPVLVATGYDGAFDSEGEPVPAWRIGVPDPEERVALWLSATGDAAIAETLGRGHRHGAGRIHGLARAGQVEAAIAGEPPSILHIVRAGRGGAATDLGSLAEPLAEAIDDDALVLPPSLRDDLEGLLARCSARDSLVDRLGPAARARHRPGVRALLYGPSGTGKTLAVGWLATRLGLPLYRVDLANVSSKYIGETEKNLAQLFARAEHAEVVLMFDEADALFGKRTDVKDSNDRYANAQTNYLLQRIESFEGIAILASNSRARFDSAFARRLDVIIEFPLPSPEERRALWLAHLGPQHELTPSQLNRLAAGCELAGGHVRNVVLAAASRSRGGVDVPSYDDLVYGLRLEYRKLGKQVPAGIERSTSSVG